MCARAHARLRVCMLVCMQMKGFTGKCFILLSLFRLLTSYQNIVGPGCTCLLLAQFETLWANVCHMYTIYMPLYTKHHQFLFHRKQEQGNTCLFSACDNFFSKQRDSIRTQIHPHALKKVHKMSSMQLLEFPPQCNADQCAD